MELPPYRIPTLRNTLKHMWHKAQQYIKKMGSVILIASIIIWALGYFPRSIEFSQDYDAQIAALHTNELITDVEREVDIQQVEFMKEAERQEKSYIGRMGHAIQPIMTPLGFDWKMGVSLISGLAAKEIVVSTMAVLYQSGDGEGDSVETLKQRLMQEKHTSGELKGEPVYTPLTALGFMLFILIYFPCIAVIAAIRKEANWQWAAFTMFYTTGLAWFVSFLVYQIGSLL